jgi:hypothetical protein
VAVNYEAVVDFISGAIVPVIDPTPCEGITLAVDGDLAVIRHATTKLEVRQFIANCSDKVINSQPMCAARAGLELLLCLFFQLSYGVMFSHVSPPD